MIDVAVIPLDESARLPNEPIVWYRRYVAYRDLGPSRRLLTVYRAERRSRWAAPVPVAWFDAADLWDWRQRTEVWDRQNAARKAQEQNDLREKERRDRVILLKAARGKLATELAKVDATAPNFAELVREMASITTQLRQEYEEA